MSLVRQHIHTGLFLMIGVLVLIGGGMGLYFMQQEQKWRDSYESLSQKLRDTEDQLTAYKLDAYTGPYGVLSYVKYNQVQSVPSSFPISNITQYQQAACQSVADAQDLPIPSTSFDLLSFTANTPLSTLPVSQLTDLQETLRNNLTIANQGSSDRRAVYDISSLCVLDASRIFLLTVDAANSALRIPIVVAREDGAWLVRRLPPTLTPFATNTLVRIHPDGNPLIFDMYQGNGESAWQAYYVDAQFQIVDLIESCRITDQGGKYVRICERLYDQGN